MARVDGHTILAPDYLRRCVETLVMTGADNVGGLMRPQGHGYAGTCIALATRSPVFSGPDDSENRSKNFSWNFSRKLGYFSGLMVLGINATSCSCGISEVSGSTFSPLRRP